MPKTSSGAAPANSGSRSVPVHRPRRTGSLTTTAARRQLAGVPLAGVDDAVLDHRGRRRAVVPEQLVEVGDVHDRDVGLVGQRVPGVRHVAVGRVVLQVDRGHVPARAAAQPLRTSSSSSGRCSTTTSTSSSRSWSGVTSRTDGRPVPGARPARARPGRARPRHGQQVLVAAAGRTTSSSDPCTCQSRIFMRAAFSGGQVRPPRVSRCTAASTSSGATLDRQGWPGTGHIAGAGVAGRALTGHRAVTVGTP